MPSAPGASGNVATEDVVFALKASGAIVPVNELLVATCGAAVRGAAAASVRLSQLPHPCESIIRGTEGVM